MTILSTFLFCCGAAMATYWIVQWLILRYRSKAPDLEGHMDFKAAETMFNSMHKTSETCAASYSGGYDRQPTCCDRCIGMILTAGCVHHVIMTDIYSSQHGSYKVM